MVNPFEPQRLLNNLFIWIPVLLSLSVHEWAHAWSAYKLGDDTAERLGRMTLNPLAHIDIFGTVLLPLLGVPFGWAKPVPVNPARFSRKVSMKTGMMITSVAGPLSNLILAVAATVVLAVDFRIRGQVVLDGSAEGHLLRMFIMVNVGLALFNMLPIPPLDGSRVVDGLLPYRLRPMWENFTRFAPFVLLAVILYSQHSGSFLSGPRNTIISGLEWLFTHLAL